MPRINTVEKSRKPVKCGRCGDTVPAGGSYRSIKPRYGGKQIRCMKSSCGFRPTDLSSAKSARIEEVIEDATVALDVAGSYDEIRAILQEVADVAREVADEYQEASDNWAGGNGHEEFQEKADTCGSFADDLEGWSPSGEQDEDAVRETAKEDCDRGAESEEEYNARLEEEQDEAWETALQEMRDEALGVLEGFSL